MNLYLDNLVFWKLYGILDMKLGKNIILKSKCYSLSRIFIQVIFVYLFTFLQNIPILVSFF